MRVSAARLQPIDLAHIAEPQTDNVKVRWILQLVIANLTANTNP